MTDPQECGRCGIEGREPDVRQTIANREREARQDSRVFVHPPFAIEYRCADKDACRARVAASRDAS